ncbi:MAG TPA: hypothetical protein VFL90_21555, partial [Methylomirabilota bacterium]|nr:hypothetical protein [Methylomirabilota bacterium]
MPPLAHAALAASIVLSALGAVVICLLIVVYGFTPSDEQPDTATRRMFLTRIGHATAAVCFAATAILLAVALAQPARTPAPATADDPRLSTTAARVEDQQERLQRMEQRVEETERAMQRLATDVERAAPHESAAPAPSPVTTPAPRPAPIRKAVTPAKRPPLVVKAPAPVAKREAPAPSTAPAQPAA